MRRMGQMSGDASESFIPPHGGYAGLLAYQKALIVFQGTVRFCERFLGKRDRTVDQMVQGARSGKQNIVEGSKVSGTPQIAPMAEGWPGSVVCAQARCTEGCVL